MKFNYEPLGNFIEEVNIRNKEVNADNLWGEEKLFGIKINKYFFPSQANTHGTKFDNYKVIYYNQFAYNPATSRNGDKISIALFKEENGLVSSAYKIFSIKDESLLNPDFLMLWFKRPEFDRYARYMSHGAVREMFTWEEMCNTKIPVPSIEIQTKIVHIISSINNRITLKMNINKNLANLIEINFKNYFLAFSDFSENEFISSEFGLIPKEWKVTDLTKIANYQNGLAMQKFPPENPEDSFKVLKIKELRQGFFDETSDLCSKNIKEECIVYDGDVIFSWSGTLLVDFWTGGTCGLNQHLFKVTSDIYDKWFYYCWTNFYLNRFIKIAEGKATTMGHIKRKHLEESLVLIPDKETYCKLTNLFKPLIELFIENKIEIRKLQKLRNTLLPKLMSGEIDVSEINCDL